MFARGSRAAQLLVMLSLNGAYGSAAPLSVAEQIEAKLERAYETAKAVRKHINARKERTRHKGEAMSRSIISVSQVSGWRAGYEDMDEKYAGFVPIALLAVVEVDETVNNVPRKERVVLPMILDGTQVIFADQRPGHRLTRITTPDQTRIV
jgi:hypothetical protein